MITFAGRSSCSLFPLHLVSRRCHNISAIITLEFILGLAPKNSPAGQDCCIIDAGSTLSETPGLRIHSPEPLNSAWLARWVKEICVHPNFPVLRAEFSDSRHKSFTSPDPTAKATVPCGWIDLTRECLENAQGSGIFIRFDDGSGAWLIDHKGGWRSNRRCQPSTEANADPE